MAVGFIKSKVNHMNIASQQAKAERFRALHQGNNLLVLPNIWDVLGAALLEDLGYPAVATASAAVALTNGYDDGEQIPLSDVLLKLAAIVKQVNLPVTADLESGYAANEDELAETIIKLLDAGVIGINLEDFDRSKGMLFTREEQCRRIKAVRAAAQSKHIHLFINARTDVYLRGNSLTTPQEKFQETISRASAYLDAGADCIFPPALTESNELEQLVKRLQCPINVLAMPGVADPKTLQSIGIARVSLGPGFLKIAIKAMRDLAIKLKNQEGWEEVLANPVSTKDLKRLIKV
jgi:2-methylisocitrate lyase-like PEP mutase family enzyme